MRTTTETHRKRSAVTATPASRPAPFLSGRLDQFFEVYRRQLERGVSERPQEYAYSLQRVPGVADRMRDSLEKRQAHVVGPAFKATCKELGIRYTQRAIYAFLSTPIEIPENAPTAIPSAGL